MLEKNCSLEDVERMIKYDKTKYDGNKNFMYILQLSIQKIIKIIKPTNIL